MQIAFWWGDIGYNDKYTQQFSDNVLTKCTYRQNYDNKPANSRSYFMLSSGQENKHTSFTNMKVIVQTALILQTNHFTSMLLIIFANFLLLNVWKTLQPCCFSLEPTGLHLQNQVNALNFQLIPRLKSFPNNRVWSCCLKCYVRWNRFSTNPLIT